MPPVLAPLLASLAFAAPAPSLHLKSCVLQNTLTVRCGTLAVPEDRRVSGGRLISLYVAVIPATTKKRLEPVFYLSGGPGSAAASDDSLFAASIFAAGPRSRDLVLVDQRGVGRSAPLVCPQPPLDADAATLLSYANGCVASTGRDPYLYTTDNAMDDVDAVRQALGYQKIVLYGGSYGATAAQVYIARHGSHVRAAVLDGATLLDVPFWDRLPANAQHAMEATAARCAAQARCRAAYPDVLGDLATTLANLRAQPTTIATGGVQVPFGADDAAHVIEGMQLSPDGIAQLPRVLHAAAAGSYELLTTAAAEAATTGPVKLMYYAIRCAEGWATGTPEGTTAASPGSYYLQANVAGLQSISVICPLLGTVIPAPDTGVVPQSNVPVLFLVGGMDPQDPLENVATARDRLPKSQTLVVPGAGHGSVQYGCMPAVAKRWFSTLKLGAADRRCAAAVQPKPFAVP